MIRCSRQRWLLRGSTDKSDKLNAISFGSHMNIAVDNSHVKTAASLIQEATTLYEAGRFSDAAVLADQAAAAAPLDPNVWNARGVFLRADGRSSEAVACYRKAISVAPDYASAWSNLGNSLKDLKQIGSAIACHHRAVELRPESALFHHNLGVALAAENRHREAISSYNRALLLKPNDADLRWDRGLSHLHLGELGQGWVDYEARFETGHLPVRNLPGQKWAGQRYHGQRLLVVAEQGFGDTLWAIRFLKYAKKLGSELIFECQKELLSLIQPLGLADRVVQKGCDLPKADWHCYLCSLPGLYTPDVATIPSAPYLIAPIERQRKFCSFFEKMPAGLRVGIVWSGSITFGGNSDRSAHFDRFVQSLALPGAQLFSLQKGPPAADLGRSASAPIIDLAPQLADFADTAAAISYLDLIIMTDSSVAHLAGAMGKPVWLLLSHRPYWLWLLGRIDSPWYPSFRLFRPKAWGHWDSVFDDAQEQLLQLLAAPRNGRSGADARAQLPLGEHQDLWGGRRPSEQQLASLG
jgi:tetratricopeptide (TPR) repeat protein